MKYLPFVVAGALLLAPAGMAAGPVAPDFSAARIEATVQFLADDLLEGRDTGSRGYEVAARYVASRFAEIGLTPGGDDGGWYQRVTFQETRRDPEALLTIGAAGDAGREWKHGGEVLIEASPNEPLLDIRAPLVFVGYGIANKLLGIDDYAGLNVKGKIVVTLRGYPKGLPSEEGAHVAATKAMAAEARGAIGILTVDTLLSAKARPWALSQRAAMTPAFTWVDPDGKPHDEAPAIRVRAALADAPAVALFAGAPRTLAAIRAVADRAGGRPRGFALKTTARIRSTNATTTVASPNIIGVLAGSDPRLRDEYVVLSAHLDHLGIAPAVFGDKPDADRIYNGALDNAAGVATLIEAAHAASLAERPRRSILFVAFTGEEKGLRGADYFAHHPPVPIGSLVADVGLDMPMLLYRFTDLIAFGADHSTMGPLAGDAVRSMGLQLSPDPMPEQGIFTRSDHYALVRRGVPAVMLATGHANGGAAVWHDFLGGAYHSVHDDLKQKIDWVAGARFAEANYRIMRSLADADAAPRWYEKDFFGDSFAPKAPKAKQP